METNCKHKLHLKPPRQISAINFYLPLTAAPRGRVACVEWQHIRVELDEIPLEIEGSVQPPQLPVEEVCHLVARSIHQTVDSEICRRGKLYRHLCWLP